MVLCRPAVRRSVGLTVGRTVDKPFVDAGAHAACMQPLRAGAQGMVKVPGCCRRGAGALCPHGGLLLIGTLRTVQKEQCERYVRPRVGAVAERGAEIGEAEREEV